MGELLDRGIQLELLEILAGNYPQQMLMNQLPDHQGNVNAVNLAYLEQHNLIAVNWYSSMQGRQPVSAVINARGLDFLQNDGGLSAILGVVTVKLHDDTIRKLLIDKIENAEGDKSVKTQLIDKVKSLPADALGTVVTKTMEAALGAAPNLLPLLTSILSRG
ncbi:hypothetical protein ACFWXH_10550 [Mesorhizobium sp. NPDC059054]|uniref:hypothetical protein n=1 Tax=Mesorhizobium sp. NPDC059054 TaxID=3346711 RepID=UPI003698693B